MKLFKFTFDESQYLVDERLIKRFSGNSNPRRFLGIFAIAVFIYGVTLAIELIFSLYQNNWKTFSVNFLNYPLIILLTSIYIAYLLLTIKYRKNNPVKKFLTISAMFLFLTMLIVEMVPMALVMTGVYLGGWVSILSGLLTGFVIYKTQYNLFSGLKRAVVEKKTFNTKSDLSADSATQLLILLGSGGVTAVAAVINIFSGGDFNAFINKVLTPFLPIVFYFVWYILQVETIRGFYIVKYLESYQQLYSELG